MKIKVKSWEEIEETFDSIHGTGNCYFPSEFAKSVCGKVFDAVPSFLESYSLKIDALNPENEVERFHLHPDWYDVIEEDAPKEPEVKENTMKIRIKSKEEIEKTVEPNGYHKADGSGFMSPYMYDDCGKELEIVPDARSPIYGVKANDWFWHPDWYDVVEEEPKKAKKREKKIHYVLGDRLRAYCGMRPFNSGVKWSSIPTSVTCKTCRKLSNLDAAKPQEEPKEDHPRYDIVEEPEVSRDEIYGPLEDLKEGDLLPGDFFTVKENIRFPKDHSFVGDLFEVLEANPPFVAATHLTGFLSGKSPIISSGDYQLFKLTKSFGQKFLDQGK